MSYQDILYLPYPRPSSRLRMSMVDRAAQFSPFAALTGHDAAIQETARLTHCRLDLALDATALLNEKIRILREHQQTHPQITATYFVPDRRKEGGAYITVSGTVREVLPQQQEIRLEDGQSLDFHRIYDLDCFLFWDLL